MVKDRLGLCYDGLLDLGVTTGTNSTRYAKADVFIEGTTRLEVERSSSLSLNSHAYGFLLFASDRKSKIRAVGRIGIHGSTTSSKESYNLGFLWGPIVDIGGQFN